MGLLSDERYAEAKIRSCAGRMGDMRLKRELRMSGVSDEAIEEAMASLEEPEEVRALRIWGRRWIPGNPGIQHVCDTKSASRGGGAARRSDVTGRPNYSVCKPLRLKSQVQKKS